MRLGEKRMGRGERGGNEETRVSHLLRAGHRMAGCTVGLGRQPAWRCVCLAVPVRLWGSE